MRGVNILNGAVGTAQEYWRSVVAENSAEARILDDVFANKAFLRNGIAELSFSRILVLGRTHKLRFRFFNAER